MEELKPCRIYIPTSMEAMPKSCSECYLESKSHFNEHSTCHETSYSTANYKANRPLWCPLKERRAAPGNKPLTLEQLMQMSGEPVYMVYVQHEYDSWMLDDDADDYVYEVCHNGATAYARKPEGDTQHGTSD